MEVGYRSSLRGHTHGHDVSAEALQSYRGWPRHLGHPGFLSDHREQTPAPASAPEGMVWIPGGEFSMGSDAASESLCACQA